MATVVTEGLLRELAGFRAENGCAISIYVDFDRSTASTVPAERAKFHSRLDEARKVADVRAHERGRDCRYALEADFERLKAWGDEDFDRDGARALAVFASSADGLFRIVPLVEPVSDGWEVGPELWIAPLAGQLGAGEGALVAVVSRERGVLYRLHEGRLQEIADETDDVPGQHDQGGLSQARYQRSVEKEVDDHLRAVGAELQRRIRTHRIAGILLGGPKETVAHLEQMLHADVGKCVRGRFDVDVWNSSSDDVLGAARPVLDELTARRDRELLERIDEGLGTGGRAAAGLNDVLPAVHERRVDTLVVQDGFTAKGTRCPQCGWLGVSAGGQCPADGTMTDVVGDIVEIAVARAFGQDARVRYLPISDTDLEQKGSIAALLRF
jgi:peptide chain release factor subunit 1